MALPVSLLLETSRAALIEIFRVSRRRGAALSSMAFRQSALSRCERYELAASPSSLTRKWAHSPEQLKLSYRRRREGVRHLREAGATKGRRRIACVAHARAPDRDAPVLGT